MRVILQKVIEPVFLGFETTSSRAGLPWRVMMTLFLRHVQILGEVVFDMAISP